MKLQGARAAAFCRAPDAGLCGALLHGPDAGLLTLRRREIAAALTGGDSLRIARLEPDTLRRDPAALDEALFSRGFFAERSVVLVEGAKDGLAEPLAALLPRLTPAENFLLATAQGLGPRSALRKLFEGAPGLAALGLYPDPPGAAEIAARLAGRGGPGRLSPEAAERLEALAALHDPGSFDRFLETLALHSAGEAELSGEAVAALAPEAAGADLDTLVAAVAAGETARIGPLLARLAAGGARPEAAVGAMARHLRRLYAITTHPDGPRAALARGPKGPLGDRLAAELRIWNEARLEAGLRLLHDAERRIRSPGRRPDAAIAERCLLRLALMVG